jgi:NUMOD3 motif
MSRRHSAETKRKMSAAHKGVKFSDERRANMKRAAQERERARRERERA